MNGQKTKDIALSCAALLFAACAFAQNGRISWSTFDMGFASPTGGNAQAISAVGQSFAAAGGSGNTWVYSGFLAILKSTGTTAVPGSKVDIPAAFSLSQNFPNPFNPATTIRYELPLASEVRLGVYDLLGREVTVLVNERKAAGVHEISFDASGLSSGVYFCRLRAGDYVAAKRILLIR